VSPNQLLEIAQAELDGLASPSDLALLQQREQAWVRALGRLLEEREEQLQRLRSQVHGAERPWVLEDFEAERDAVAKRIAQLTGDEPEDSGETLLQVSWGEGAVAVWGGGHDAAADDLDTLRDRMADLGLPGQGWQEREPLKLPGDEKVEALEAPVPAVLGWLVSLGVEDDLDGHGASVRWAGLAAALAVRQAARGAAVPTLGTTDTGTNRTDRGRTGVHVNWRVGLVDRDELRTLAKAMPSVVALQLPGNDPVQQTLAVLDDVVTAICRDAARRLEVPAAPDEAHSMAETSEVVLSRLDGREFTAPAREVAELRRGMDRWGRALAGELETPLTLQLDPPSDDGAWELHALASPDGDRLEPVEAAMSNANDARRARIKRQLERIERCYAPLRRGRVRGEVILSQNEAFELMGHVGRGLATAGFDIQVPPLRRRKAAVSMRLTTEGTSDSAVGATQLANVAWSVVLEGDVELDAAAIRRLASESRPMVRSRGQWVEVDHADLEQAAEALAERAREKEMTGAQMLRYALGLEDAPFGSVSLAGEGWAAGLLRSAQDVPEAPPTTLEGFDGELRTYQADAAAWLDFLEQAGLGGILALDMGLGKTPVMLANLRGTRGGGPALVIAPPAVVGNWASEAARFVPGMVVEVHHGPNRVDEADLPKLAGKADVIITTYGTAVRDISALSSIEWNKVVLDEAQVIKNHTSETAQQLRRLEARTRVALTGTPIENGLGDLWALLDFTNPGLVGGRTPFINQLQRTNEGVGSSAEQALRTLNGVLVFRRTKAEPAIAAELPDRIDELENCHMTKEQVGLYQAVLDDLVVKSSREEGQPGKKGAVLAAITALKQICNHPAAYVKDDDGALDGRSGKLARLDEILENVFASGERALIFTHFASWGEKLAEYLTTKHGVPVGCYHGGLSRGARDQLVEHFQASEGPGAMVLSLKAGGTGLNLTAASHVVLYDRWWNPAVEDQARDRVWRIGQTRTVVCHRLIVPGTVDERVEEVVAGKRRIADLVLPKSSSVGDLDSEQLRSALGIDADSLLVDEDEDV